MITERFKFIDPDFRSHGLSGKPQCYVCGKNVREPARYWLYAVNGGLDALHKDDVAAYEAKQAASNHEYDRGDCGMHPVGPECRKRLPDYTFTR